MASWRRRGVCRGWWGIKEGGAQGGAEEYGIVIEVVIYGHLPHLLVISGVALRVAV